MAMSTSEVNVKIAEIAADLVKQHMQTVPSLYVKKEDMAGAVELVYDLLQKNWLQGLSTRHKDPSGRWIILSRPNNI